MSELSKIVFGNGAVTKEIEIQGHKIVIRKLVAKDNLEMNFDFTEVKDDDTKSLLKMAIDVLSSAIVSIDGISSNKKEMEEYLLNQETTLIFEILNKSDILGMAQEVKN
jgi:predicted nucleic acid-binding protein